jgi:predicted nucleotidyltransferase
MPAFDELRKYFTASPEVGAVYQYGTYAVDETFPDSDIELGLVFLPDLGDEEVAAFMERLSEDNPLGPAQGVLMPFPLNDHILPVVHEIVHHGHLLVDRDPLVREAFIRDVDARMQQGRPKLLDEAREVLQQARNLGEGLPTFPARAGRPLRMVDPVRVGWRLGRVLTSVAVLEVGTRDIEEAAREAERVNQMVGWFSNAAGAATGIAKAMLTTYATPRPPRRWQIFFPLADLGLLTVEQALWLGAMVETRWNLILAEQISTPERVLSLLRTYVPHLLHFARIAAWAADMPASGETSRIH